MPAAALPANELDRLRDLHRYQVLDTPPDTALDALTQLAARIAETPIAAISLTDENRQWFKSRVGLEPAEVPRDWAPCAHAVAAGESVVCPDMTLDPRFADNPLVTGPPHFRFYAGMALRTPRGSVLGTLAVIDTAPRTLTAFQLETLELIASQIVDQLELRTSYRELAELRRQEQAFEQRLLREKAEEAQQLAAELHDGVCQDLTGIGMLLGSALEQASRHDPALASKLGEVRRMLGATIDNCRSTAQKQGGFLIRKEGLGGAIGELAHELERTGDSRFAVERCKPEITCLDEPTAYHFFRIVGEAMTNACRHSGAREVRVQLSHGGGAVRCEVEDDGLYKSGCGGSAGGVGQSVMAYRARAIGAALDFSEHPGGGLRVVCVLGCGCGPSG